MKAAGLIGAGLLVGARLMAAEEPPAGAALDDAVQAMLSTRESPQALHEAIDRARALGATPQAVLEARFLYHVDRRDDDALVAMLPEMEARAATFRTSDSEIFALEDDWLAVLEYVRALAALDRDDGKAFRRHITEAFWLSPGQGPIFAPYIEAFRREQALQQVRLAPGLPLRDLDGQPTTLGALRGDQPAGVIHFFSPWSPESETAVPVLRRLAAALDPAGVPLVHVLVDADADALAETRTLFESGSPPLPGNWFTDPSATPLTEILRVRTTPTVAIVDAKGRIAFIGHPADAGLATALQKLLPDREFPSWREQTR